MPRVFFFAFLLVFLGVCVCGFFEPRFLWIHAVLLPLFGLGVKDYLQRRHAILRNFPIVGHFRYLLELIRPEINQYFIESNTDGRPYNREQRDVSYQRAKKVRDTVPFGTQRDVYATGYEWINHSLAAREPAPAPRIKIGAERCSKPYEASLLNISGMSFGSLSGPAIRALNGGAKLGGFFHNTGEGSVSEHHLAPGGDLCWQVGTGYFGCRAKDGGFDSGAFGERSRDGAIKLIELKLSQGAKPGHGGILPAVKITPEIARIRGVAMGADILSPPSHKAFSDPRGLLAFLDQLRELSGGKPVGFKLCLGTPAEFLGLCMAMRETDTLPDFITIDGGEGGTGAAPVEFANSVGSPLTEGLVFVHNALVGFGLRERVKLIASGKVMTGFDIAARLAVGADICSAARGFMFALGCIQARRCNANVCPVGVATQDPLLVRGLDAGDKQVRVHNFQEETVGAFMEILGAAGLEHPDELRPWHIFRRSSAIEVKTYAEIYDYLEPGELIEGSPPPAWKAWVSRANPDAFLGTRTLARREGRQPDLTS